MPKKRSADPGASNEEAYLIAFGSTMTILLALFIVLSVLASSQEGGFKKGTGSFVRALDTFGLSGLFDRSPEAVDFDAVSPHYQVGEGATGDRGGLEDREEKSGEVNDYEQERLTRALQELRRQFDASQPQRQVIGVAVVPFQTPLNPEPPHLTEEHRSKIIELLPALLDQGRRVYVEVGVAETNAAALAQAAQAAVAIKGEIAQLARRSPGELKHLIPLGRTRPGEGTSLALRLLFVR